MAIANKMFSPMPKIFVRHFKCSVQTNTNDCGFTPWQIWVSIFNGIDPSGITYTVSKIRDHLIKENQNITVYNQLCFIIDIICDLFIARND